MALHAQGMAGTTPEERLYKNEKKSIEQLVHNYQKSPSSWSGERLEKLALLADKYQVPFAIKDPTIGQYLGAFTGGVGDALVFGAVPDKAYVVPGAEGAATAGKVVGTVGSIIAAAMSLGTSTGAQATVGGAGLAVKGTAGAVNAAKALGSAGKIVHGAKQVGGGLVKGGRFIGRNFTLPGVSRQLMKPLAKGIAPALSAAGVKGGFVSAGINMAKRDGLKNVDKLIKAGKNTEALEVLKKVGASADEVKSITSTMFGGNKALIKAAVKDIGLDPKGAVTGNSQIISQLIGNRREGTAVSAKSLRNWIKSWNTKKGNPKISKAVEDQIVKEITEAEIKTIGELALEMSKKLGGAAATTPLSSIGIGNTALGAGGLGLVSMGNMSTEKQFDPYKDLLAQMPTTPTAG